MDPKCASRMYTVQTRQLTKEVALRASCACRTLRPQVTGLPRRQPRDQEPPRARLPGTAQRLSLPCTASQVRFAAHLRVNSYSRNHGLTGTCPATALESIAGRHCAFVTGLRHAREAYQSQSVQGWPGSLKHACTHPHCTPALRTAEHQHTCTTPLAEAQSVVNLTFSRRACDTQ